MQSKKILLSKWVGEFGWEVIHYQSYIRKIISLEEPKFDKVILLIQKGHDHLYSNLGCDNVEFIYIEPGKNPEGWRAMNGHYNPSFTDLEINSIKHSNHTDQVIVNCPNKINMSIPIAEKMFIKYGTKKRGLMYDVLFHARSTNKCGSKNRNWPKQKWPQLMEHLHGLNIACIGSMEGSIAIKGTKDFRGITLSHLTDLMASSGMVIGPSSGPMHLASLCGTPHIVFTDNNEWGGVGTKIKTNKYRYEVAWNPFGTKCFVMDNCNWNPKVTAVAAAVKDFYKCWAAEVSADKNYFNDKERT